MSILIPTRRRDRCRLLKRYPGLLRDVRMALTTDRPSQPTVSMVFHGRTRSARITAEILRQLAERQKAEQRERRAS